METLVEKERQVAQYLLQIKAVVLQPDDPFTWASGWKSPIYCDNRLILSYPKIRLKVADAFVHAVTNNRIDRVAGVATGGIAHAAYVADKMNLPMCYVRDAKKGHGRQNQVEGVLNEGDRVLMIEDLVSTGGSSLRAVQGMRERGAEVTELLSVFSYGFQQADEAFETAGVRYAPLTTYPTLIEEALKGGYVNEDQLAALNDWRSAPSEWGQ